MIGNKCLECALGKVISCGHYGCTLVGEIKKGKYIYYRCTQFKRYMERAGIQFAVGIRYYRRHTWLNQHAPGKLKYC